jgi:chromosomal replication initiation ATPase DnaA
MDTKTILYHAELFLSKICGTKIVCVSINDTEDNSVRNNDILNNALDVVSKHTGALRELILKHYRKRELVEARQILCHLLSKKGLLYPEISILIGFERTTSLHLLESIQDRMILDKDFKIFVDKILADYLAIS